MKPVTVVDVSGTPKMTSTGYIGQDPDTLKRDLAYRRKMLAAPRISRERLICIGEDRYGKRFYTDVGNYNDIGRYPWEDREEELW